MIVIRRRWPEITLWGLLFAVLFALGWVRGNHPQWSWRDLLPSRDPIVIMTSDANWLPATFIKKISEETEMEFRIEKVDDFTDFEARMVLLDAPSLVWIPLSWAKGLDSQKLLRPYVLKSRDRKLIHPDFATMTPDLSYIPVLWQIENSDLHLEGLAIPSNAKDRGAALKILEKWISSENALAQLKAVPGVSSALSFSDQADLQPEQKASALRNQSLLRLKTWK